MFGPAPAKDAEFTAFVRSATPTLTRTAYLLTGDRETASDLVQEAFVRTYLAWRRVRKDEATAYARRVLVNLNVDRYRRPSAVPVAMVAERAVDHEEGRVDDRDELRRMLASLAPQQRRVIVLRYFDDLSEAEVAQCLGVTVGSVKASCSRGLAALRGAFAPAMEGGSR